MKGQVPPNKVRFDPFVKLLEAHKTKHFMFIFESKADPEFLSSNFRPITIKQEGGIDIHSYNLGF